MGSTPTLGGTKPGALRIGPYLIQGKPLGKGGMGTVYHVVDAQGKSHAVKEFSPLFCRDRLMKARFKQEHEILRSLSHPNVVKVKELFTANGTLNICMELLVGKDLKSLMRQQKVLSPGVAFAIGAKVAAALEHAHGKGVLHRDVKPENIYVTEKGKVKLTDFGVARVGPGGLTVAGSVVGTPDYLSPEQLEGLTDLTPSADLYSLAVVLYEMIEGKLPHGRMGKKGLVEMAKKRATIPPRPPQAIAEVEARDLIMACLEADPNKRPATAKEVAKALGRWEDAMAEKQLATMVGTGPSPIKRRRSRDEPALISIPTQQIRRVAETAIGLGVLIGSLWLGLNWVLGGGSPLEMIQWIWGLMLAIGWGLLGG